MKPAIPSIVGDLASGPGKWRVELQDVKTGRIMPVIVPEADAEFRAVTAAMNQAARFFPGCDFKPGLAHRTA